MVAVELKTSLKYCTAHKEKGSLLASKQCVKLNISYENKSAQKGVAAM